MATAEGRVESISELPLDSKNSSYHSSLKSNGQSETRNYDDGIGKPAGPKTGEGVS